MLQVGIDIAHFHEFKDSIEFTKQLLVEQAVFCLPGEVCSSKYFEMKQRLYTNNVFHYHPSQAFHYPGYLRVVLVMPRDKIEEACQRVTKFCSQHYK